MTLAKATYGYLVDWNNDGDFGEANEDITAYVLSAQWEYGVDWSSVPGRSKIGACRIKLDNSTGLFSSYNSGSAIQASLLPGRAVKVTMTIAPAAAVTMWLGYLESILPSPGAVVGVSTAELLAYGPLSQISDTEVHLALQTNHTTGALVTHILDAASYSASLRAIDTGQSTLSKFFVLRDSNALSVLRELEDAECGLIRETKDGKIAWEDRAHRITAPHDAAIATFGSGGLYHWRMTQEDPANGICNAIQTDVRTFNVSDEMQLAVVADIRNGLGGAAIPIAGSGGTRTVRIEFPTANSPSYAISVSDWTIVTYEANTAADISGTDITTDVSAVKTEYADHIEIVFTNAGAAGYIVVLKADGTAIVEGDPIPVKDSDGPRTTPTTSQAKYGIRNYPSPSRWLTDIDVAEDYCAHLLALYKDPVPRVTFELMANYDAAHLAQAQALDVSDRIHLDAPAATYSLGISQDCFIEYIRHKVDSQSIHTVEYQCRAVKSNTWAASAAPYTDKIVSPPGAPAGYICNAMDPDSRVIIGIQATEFTAGIDQAEFRAKLVAAGTNYPSVDLRTVAEGGTLAHDELTDWVIEGCGATAEHGAQAIIYVPTQGVLFYAARLRNAQGGWGLWSDGNYLPKVTTARLALEDPSHADTAPAADWSISVKEGSVSGTAVVTFGRPATMGNKVVAIVVQIVNANAAGFGWLAIDDASKVIYDGSAVAHTYNKIAMTITKAAGNYGAAAAGDLILFDVRGGAFDKQYCGWGTIPTGGISGTTLKYLPGFIPAFEPDGSGNYADIRIKIVSPPWNWTTNGYLGGEANRGLWEKVYWIPPNQGDKTTQTFVTEPIQLPSGVAITDVKARVWYQNGYQTRSDDDTYSDFGTAGGSATGEGCIKLTVAAGAVATDVNLGRVFAIDSNANYTISNPTGSTFCGMTVLWMCSGAGLPTLGSKFRLMDGESVEKSYSRDLLGAIYNAADDQWDAFWKKGTLVASASPSASRSASTSASRSASVSSSASAS